MLGTPLAWGKGMVVDELDLSTSIGMEYRLRGTATVMSLPQGSKSFYSSWRSSSKALGTRASRTPKLWWARLDAWFALCPTLAQANSPCMQRCTRRHSGFARRKMVSCASGGRPQQAIRRGAHCGHPPTRGPTVGLLHRHSCVSMGWRRGPVEDRSRRRWRDLAVVCVRDSAVLPRRRGPPQDAARCRLTPAAGVAPGRPRRPRTERDVGPPGVSALTRQLQSAQTLAVAGQWRRKAVPFGAFASSAMARAGGSHAVAGRRMPARGVPHHPASCRSFCRLRWLQSGNILARSRAAFAASLEVQVRGAPASVSRRPPSASGRPQCPAPPRVAVPLPAQPPTARCRALRGTSLPGEPPGAGKAEGFTSVVCQGTTLLGRPCPMLRGDPGNAPPRVLRRSPRAGAARRVRVPNRMLGPWAVRPAAAARPRRSRCLSLTVRSVFACARPSPAIHADPRSGSEWNGME